MASATLVGIDAVPVDVEVDVATGLPGYHVVGLPTVAVKEGGVRIRAALEQAGLSLPHRKITVNLAPADLRKPGTAFDLPIAAGVLIGDELFEAAPLVGLVLLGELGLDGSVRAVRGALAAAVDARARGMRGIVVPAANAAEAAVVEGLEVYALSHLSELLATLAGHAPLPMARVGVVAARAHEPDLCDVRGQVDARAALEVAVAGGHNLMFTGPPGIGKTMLARRVPSILPPMTQIEALETSKVYSAMGQCGGGLVDVRPFRAPHHTVSAAALLGGGAVPRPGEISLAHNGVLFLDELPEFSRSTLEGLRQPLEDRLIQIHRVGGHIRLPASFLLVASANPCPCGWRHSEVRECTCGLAAIERYRARLSGPILDRIDLGVFVRPVELQDLRSDTLGESSSAVRTRVAEARIRQQHRLARHGVRCNAEMSSTVMRQTCRLTTDAETVLAQVHAKRRGLSARGVDRIIKVARTIADLGGHEQIDADSLREAASYRAANDA